MTYEPWPRLEKPTRAKIAALGAAAWIATVPAGFVGLMIFGFHGRLEEMDWDERLALHTLPLLPLILALLGLACFLCFTRRGLLIVKALAALAILDAVLLVFSFQSMNRPDPSFVRSVTLPAPPVSASGPVTGVAGPTRVSIACSATGDECWTTRLEGGRVVSRERSTGSRRPPRP
ncbi:MAG TPA: hypothetical protein VF574_11345 [Allosphingosinicella sp.]|jgi:hypothetical protein